MKASVEKLNSVQRRIKVEVAAENVDKAFETAYKGIQRKAQIQGFRPGKAPMHMIKKLYAQKVAYDVLDVLVKENLFVAIEQNQLRPIASPVLESLAELPASGQQYSFSAVVDILPEIEIGTYRGLPVAVEPNQFDSAAVERELENLLRRNASTKAVADGTTAHSGLMATISHTVTRDGVAVDQFDAKDIQVELGRGDLFADLEKAIIGMAIGAEKAVTVTLPKDYPDQELANQKLDFQLKLDQLQELVIPKLDDDFAKDLGMEDLAKLRDAISKNMQSHAEQTRRQAIETSLLDQIVQRSPFDVPPAMVDQVIDSMIDNIRWPNDKERAKAKQDQDMRLKFRDNAKRQVQNTLVLWEVAKKENLQVSDADLDEHISKMFGEQKTDDAQLAKMRNALGGQMREKLLFEKALHIIVDSAKVSDKTISKP